MEGARGSAREERWEESIRHLRSVSGWRWRGSAGGLAGWGADVRCSIKPCEDSVINPLKMSDCRWLWEYQSGGWARGAGAAAAALLVMVLVGGEGYKMDARMRGIGKAERQVEWTSEINWDKADTVAFKWEEWVSVTTEEKERKGWKNRELIMRGAGQSIAHSTVGIKSSTRCHM